MRTGEGTTIRIQWTTGSCLAGLILLIACGDGGGVVDAREGTVADATGGQDARPFDATPATDARGREDGGARSDAGVDDDAGPRADAGMNDAGAADAGLPDGGAPRAWSAPEVIDRAVPPVYLNYPMDSAIDGSGNAFVTWMRYRDGGPGRFHVRRFTPAGGWGPIEFEGEGVLPMVRCDPAGNAIVVWSIRSRVMAVRFDPATGWGASQELRPRMQTTGHFQLTMNDRGEAMATWTAARVGATGVRLWAARFTPAGGWERARQVSDDTGDVGNPDIRLDEEGNGLAVWSRSLYLPGDPTPQTVWASRFTVAGGWTPPELLSGEDSGVAATLAMHPSGAADAIWHEGSGASPTLVHSHFTPETGWGARTTLSEALPSSIDGVVNVDETGRAWVLWHEGDFPYRVVRLSRFTVTSGWEKFDPPESLYAAGFAFDAEDNGIFAFLGGPQTALFDVRGTRYSPQIGWAPSQLLDDLDGVQADRVQVVANAAGDALVTYHQGGGFYAVMYR